MNCCFIWDIISFFLYDKELKKSGENDDVGRRYKGDKL